MTDGMSMWTTAKAGARPVLAGAVDEELVRQLGERARAEGLQLTGECGLLARLTKMVVESALEWEMEGHLGYARHDPAGRDGGNSRNGTRALLNPAAPPPAKEWVTLAEASVTKRPGPVVDLTGKLHIEYSFTAPAVAYLQPATGPAITVQESEAKLTEIRKLLVEPTP